MIRRPPRSTPLYSSAASDVYKRQGGGCPFLVQQRCQTYALRRGALEPAVKQRSKLHLNHVAPREVHGRVAGADQRHVGSANRCLYVQRGLVGEYWETAADVRCWNARRSISIAGKRAENDLWPSVLNPPDQSAAQGEVSVGCYAIGGESKRTVHARC